VTILVNSAVTTSGEWRFRTVRRVIDLPLVKLGTIPHFQAEITCIKYSIM